MRTGRILTLGGLIGGGFYLLLIDTTSLPELYVLAGVLVLCALGFLMAREEDFVEARFKPQWLGRAWRLGWMIPADIATLCREAVAQLTRPKRARGAFRATAFAARAKSSEDTGRRALAEWLGSVSPNTIVVGVDDERGLLLVHQLRRRGAAEELDVLGLG